MNNLQKIMLLKDRLNRLERNDKDNFNICRRIRREIEQLRRQEQRMQKPVTEQCSGGWKPILRQEQT